MSDRENLELISIDFINNVVGKSTEEVASINAVKHRTKLRVLQHKIGRSLKLSQKRITKLNVRF